MFAMIGKRATLVSAIAAAAMVAAAIWLFGGSDFVSLPLTNGASGIPSNDVATSIEAASEVGSIEAAENEPDSSTGRPDGVAVQTVGEAYPALVSAATDGDPTASIALAKGLAACADRADLRTRFGDLRSRAERMTKVATSAGATDQDKMAMDRSIMVMDEAKARLDAKELTCNGISESAIKNRWRQQLAAAKTGDADMIVDFVSHPAVDPREAYGDDSGVRAYRENAPQLLEQLIQSGDLRGYQVYVRAGYDTLMRRDEYRFHDALSRVIKPDPIRVLAYDIALGQSGLGAFGSGPDHDALRNRQLDPVQRLAAEAMAREIGPDVAAAVARWLALNPPRSAQG